MTASWVMVANSSSADIFAINNGHDMERIYHIDFPDGREKSGKILSDRPGRSFDRRGGNRHALGTEVDVHMHEQQIFARQLAELLHKAKCDNEFSKLALIAPPQFLGELRNMLSDLVKKSIYKEINKDIPAARSEQERKDSICKFLELTSLKTP